MQKHYSHGEVNFFETKSIPKEAKKLKLNQNYFIVGESETHGNDHRVAIADSTKVEIFEKDGILYMKNAVPVDVYCPTPNRHDTITLQPSIWEIDKAKEYDYTTQEQRNVRD